MSWAVRMTKRNTDGLARSRRRALGCRSPGRLAATAEGFTIEKVGIDLYLSAGILT
jgi:hypothetical protein